MQRSFLRRFWHGRDGATIVEFAIVAPIFFLLIMAILEFGLFMFHKVAIEAIAMQVGREATLGKENASPPCDTVSSREAYIRCYVANKANGLIDSSEVVIEINPVDSGGTDIPPDICLDNPQRPSSQPVSCKSWEEVNNVKDYQGVAAMNTGTAGQLVEVRISYPWRVILPFMKQFFGTKQEGSDETSGTVLITSSTIIKNEPFGATP